MLKVSFNIAFCFIVFFSVSCKKDKDAIPPKIQITSPYENQIFNVYESFDIKAKITDDKQLLNLSIKLLDENQLIWQVPVSLSITGTEFQLNRRYNLYDLHLPSGNYYIRISASDGVNEGVAYMKIYINAAPTVRKAIYAVTQSAGLLNLVKVDSALNLSNELNFVSDYSGSGISSYYQTIYVAGNLTGGFRAIDAPNKSVKWSINPTIGTNPFFTGLSIQKNLPYISYYSGEVKLHTDYGNSVFTASTNAGNFFPMKAIFNGNYSLVEAKDKVSTVKKIFSFLSSTGLPINETYINGDVVEFVPKNGNEVFVLLNDGSQSYMTLYDISNNSFFSPHTIPTGKILSAVKIDADNFVIGHSNGIIYRYQIPTNSLTSLVTSVEPNKLKFDAVNSQLIIAESKRILIYNYSPSISTSVGSVALTDSILDVHILFNK